MKGYLKRLDNEWKIKYVVYLESEYRMRQYFLPLHPDDSIKLDQYKWKFEKMDLNLINYYEVDFDVVYCCKCSKSDSKNCGSEFCDDKKFAKLDSSSILHLDGE